MLTVLSVKALQAPQGTRIETLHTMLVHLLVVQLAFLLKNARRSWQGSKACAKTCTTRRGSGHVDVEQIKRVDNKQSYQHRPQTGRQQNKET